jgi:hypothetical protein
VTKPISLEQVERLLDALATEFSLFMVETNPAEDFQAQPPEVRHQSVALYSELVREQFRARSWMILQPMMDAATAANAALR